MALLVNKYICPYSKEEFIPKRSNQIYAKPEYRIAFNNQRGNDKRKLLAPKNKLLKNNREILKSILELNSKGIVHVEYLKGAGFSFQVFTHLTYDKVFNKNAFSVYEFSYIQLADSPKYFKIFKND